MNGAPIIMPAMLRIGILLRPGLLALVALLGWTSVAFGQSTERLGDFGDWSAFRFSEDGNKSCYIASQPAKAEGNYTRRGDIYALVTHRPAENRRDEVNVIIGYTFQVNSFVDVTIGGQTFKLFTKDDGAWTTNSDEDRRLVQAMIQGNRMVVKGTSSRGTLTTDTYSLKGFTAAYRKINDVCGVE